MGVYTWFLVPVEVRGIELQQADITNSCEPPNVGTGIKWNPLGKQYVPLTASYLSTPS